MKEDYKVLRNLATKKREIVEMFNNDRNIRLWKDTNDLKSNLAPVQIYQVPWHEINHEQLALKCKNKYLREIEDGIRKEIYTMQHFPCNMIFKNEIMCEAVVYDSDFGLKERSKTISPEKGSRALARQFKPSIRGPEDIKKLKQPEIYYDEKLTMRRFAVLKDIFDGRLEVRLTGKRGYWFTPWDNLVRYTGVEQMMIDLIERPEYIEELVNHFVQLSLFRLKTYNELNVWGSNNNNVSVGSGGYGYTHDLKEEERNNIGTSTKEMWGCGNAQVFSEVSEQMHWDFSLKYEIKWLENFGLNYYGCCEQLHNKIGILEKIPNLRKISMSPWADLKKAVEVIDNRYVLSIKPNPSYLAMDAFDDDVIKKEINDILDKSENSSKEIILKDISTVKHQPERIDRWAAIVMEEIKNRYN
ncbi:MAG: hypothetical protein JXQ23_05430 [Clostridia bacterium]|nr:hypothetical protein [Clostridia bacterium]